MLYIITPCSRPENIEDISKTIPSEAHWIICHDNKVTLPNNINADVLVCDDSGFVGSMALNHVLDTYQFLDNDYILIHDDDNIIHPKLYETISHYLNSNYDFSI